MEVEVQRERTKEGERHTKEDFLGLGRLEMKWGRMFSGSFYLIKFVDLNINYMFKLID